MMSKAPLYFLIVMISILTAFPVLAAVKIGQAAPVFNSVDTNGEPFNLDDYKGKTVVLEWSNHQCPFIIKHYGTGNMQRAQEIAVGKDVVWVTIRSSAPGKQGHVSAIQANEIARETGSHATIQILDPDGEIGKLYGAKTTPHMFIVDKDGTLVYAGAIDDNTSPNPETVKGAKNYILAALDDLEAGRPVQTAQTAPYGCSVKY
jgi:hypothetical protein